jgi:hypothetical protein
MKYLKKFESFPGEAVIATIDSTNNIVANDEVKKLNITNTIYDTSWEKYLPETIIIHYHGKEYSFKKGNIMLLDDMIEISYDSNPENPWGCPDTLEFDLYFTKDTNTNKIRINVDITYGDLMACEFSLEAPNKINVLQYTSYHSKFDPSNTSFALEDKSLDAFIEFLNRFNGVKISREDTKFLDKYDNYKPQLFSKDVHDMNKVDNANDNSNK